jgi:o-succinylbenzoate synthase
VARIARAYRIPLRARFRGLDVREGLLLKGPSGWGEFSPFAAYGPEAAASWLAAAREATDGTWPAPVRSEVPVNTTIPAVDAERAFEMARASGCSTAKVKVGEGEDIARVEAVRDALGPNGRIRVDVNGAWSVSDAQRHIEELERFDLEYVEQPVTALEEMIDLRRRVGVPLAADESIRGARDPMQAARAGGADIIVLKVQPLGGVRRCLEIAEAAGLPCVVSSALETSVGIAAGLALAAALPELPYACGLGTVSLLEHDVVADPLVPVRGVLAMRRPEVDEHALACVEGDPAPWLRRIEEADAWAR